MFQNTLYPSSPLTSSSYTQNLYSRQYNLALNQFRSALRKGKFFRLKRRVLHRQEYLYDLDTLKKTLTMRGSSYSGIQVVRISSIIGSEGRSTDFDMDFLPTSEAARERWVNMAIVHLSRIPLPPVQLIQIGEVYFVRDGHHRISVSQLFGQVAMDAEVITWKASPPFPWQPAAASEAACCLSPAEVSA
jgi:hypothetical protein